MLRSELRKRKMGKVHLGQELCDKTALEHLPWPGKIKQPMKPSKIFHRSSSQQLQGDECQHSEQLPQRLEIQLNSKNTPANHPSASEALWQK